MASGGAWDAWDKTTHLRCSERTLSNRTFCGDVYNVHGLSRKHPAM